MELEACSEMECSSVTGRVAVFAGWLALRYALDEELAEIPSSVSRT